MSNLIERQSAIDEWKNDFKGYVNSINIPRDDYNGIMEYIDELPSAEPEIIHCKDCDGYLGDGRCVHDDDLWGDDDFCSRAERRADG